MDHYLHLADRILEIAQQKACHQARRDLAASGILAFLRAVSGVTAG
ncbi:hypothetical protein HCN51_20430 [Nonomuraea sp. FMUSA5-5]|uniref:Uncharacterized protein n=1 Tax=Nonomuraea composti TaxID=2720023 RepID=A0ABX1B5U0_9ACTN|nr:hypothetical protein [Nonomuraea sp. FMUSA5-5]NJP91797.1 hypothetical protein [Nonomuraea sp. FMUSA5-5]